MPEPHQTTIYGATEPLPAPAARHEQPRLFAAPQTIRGQLAIDTECDTDARSEDQPAPRAES